jgi:hypothetical protein
VWSVAVELVRSNCSEKTHKQTNRQTHTLTESSARGSAPLLKRSSITERFTGTARQARWRGVLPLCHERIRDDEEQTTHALFLELMSALPSNKWQIITSQLRRTARSHTRCRAVSPDCGRPWTVTDADERKTKRLTSFGIRGSAPRIKRSTTLWTCPNKQAV